MQNIVHIQVDTLVKFMEEVFQGLGVPPEDAAICADVLINSDLRGIDSHGVGRLKMYYDRIKEGIQFPVTKISIIKESGTTATLDGNHGMGHVIGYKAMEMALDKAEEYGLGAVAVRNSTHYGFAGYYPLMAIDRGMVGITVTNARPSIAPTFGIEPMFGTNPLTFGAPSDEAFPFLIDAATSISQRGKIEYLDRAEKPTPKGWAIDDTGNEHTDTKQLLDDLVKGTAALLPMGGLGEIFGGHKGYGWAILVEILSAALQDGAFLKGLSGYDKDGKRAPYALGHFFLALNVENFISLDRFKKVTGNIMRSLRESEKAPGSLRIYTAGEKEYEIMEQRKTQGIPVNVNLQKNLKAMEAELDIKGFDFPF